MRGDMYVGSWIGWSAASEKRAEQGDQLGEQERKKGLWRNGGKRAGAWEKEVFLPIAVNPTRGFNCYFPMPFARKARITIENQNEEAIPAFFYQVDFCLTDGLPENTGYFHARWRRRRLTEKGVDYCILDGVKGHGQYVGTYFGISLLFLSRYVPAP